MEEKIILCQGVITSKGVDGEPISCGDGTSPIRFELNSATQENKVVKLAVRCSGGYWSEEIALYATKKNSKDTSDAGSKFILCEDENFKTDEDVELNGRWNTTLKIKNVGDTNKIFWLRGMSDKKDKEGEDNTYLLHAEGVLRAGEAPAEDPGNADDSSKSIDGGQDNVPADGDKPQA